MPPRIDLDLDAVRDACRRVAPALGTRLPIHQGVRITSADRLVTFEAQNDDLRFATQVEVATDLEPLDAIVPGRLFLRFLNRMEPVPVRLELDASAAVLTASAQGAELSAPLFPLENWAQWSRTTAPRLALAPSDLQAIGRVLYAASPDPDRGVLTGVHLAGRVVTATDNTRLAQAALGIDLGPVVVPTGFFRSALRGVAPDSSLEIELSQDGVRLSDGTSEWNARAIMGSFPNAASLLSGKATGRVRVSRAWLVSALERLSILEGADLVRLTATGSGRVELEAGTVETGRIVESAICEGDWSGHVKFRLAHLIDASHASSAEVFDLRFTGDGKPALIFEEGLKQAILPIR